MDDRSRKESSCGTQIDDLPSCLIMDILLRLTTPSLLSCRVVCKSWNLVFSDPLLARSPTYIVRWNLAKPMKFYRSYCRSLVSGLLIEPFASQANDTLRESMYTCINSCNGLLCLDTYRSPDEVYVCNPILGQYITIKTSDTERVRFNLGFSSRSNQFKVLQINRPKQTGPSMGRIYTIGDGTGEWKNIGIAPFCRWFEGGGFLNGSIHWVDEQTHQIVYFNFDSEQFGSLPSPPELRGRWPEEMLVLKMGVSDGCLSFYLCGLYSPVREFWIMKEYGVEESWTKIYNGLSFGTAYNPSFISLQDVAKGEQLTFIS